MTKGRRVAEGCDPYGKRTIDNAACRDVTPYGSVVGVFYWL